MSHTSRWSKKTPALLKLMTPASKTKNAKIGDQKKSTNGSRFIKLISQMVEMKIN